jgi:predicted small lipoprotein YifL
MKQLPITLAALLTLTLALSACGKRGDLIAPGEDDSADEARLEQPIRLTLTS